MGTEWCEFGLFCTLLQIVEWTFLKESNSFVFSSHRTSYFTCQDGTCVWVPVMSIPLWPPATPQTNTNTGPLSECANHHFKTIVPLYALAYYEMGILNCMQLACRFFSFLFFRLLTMTFNLFLYIEEVNCCCCCCCWEVWGGNHSVPLLKEAFKLNYKTWEQPRCSVLTSPSFVSSQPIRRVRYVNLTVNIFPVWHVSKITQWTN